MRRVSAALQLRISRIMSRPAAVGAPLSLLPHGQHAPPLQVFVDVATCAPSRWQPCLLPPRPRGHPPARARCVHAAWESSRCRRRRWHAGMAGECLHGQRALRHLAQPELLQQQHACGRRRQSWVVRARGARLGIRMPSHRRQRHAQLQGAMLSVKLWRCHCLHAALSGLPPPSLSVLPPCALHTPCR